MHEFVNKAVGDAFKPLGISKILRAHVWRLIGTGLLIAVGFAPMPAYIKVQLLIWITYRTVVLFTALWVGTEIVDERERRLSALPGGWRQFLVNGGKAPAVDGGVDALAAYVRRTSKFGGGVR